MSFYFTVKGAKLLQQRKNLTREKVAVVITSENNRLFTYFTPTQSKVQWNDAFVAESSERQLQVMLIKQKSPGKSAIRMSSNSISLSKYLFWEEDGLEEIALYDDRGKHTDTLILEISYRQHKHFIGPIQFYRRGSNQVDNEDGQIPIDIEGDKSNFGFWNLFNRNKKNSNTSSFDDKRNTIKNEGASYMPDCEPFALIGKNDKNNQYLKPDNKNRYGYGNKVDNKQTSSLTKSQLRKRQNIKFYKGAHKNRNIFSFCDQVHDDQKFTVVQNYYDD